jgi:hypothetical protein
MYDYLFYRRVITFFLAPFCAQSLTAQFIRLYFYRQNNNFLSLESKYPYSLLLTSLIRFLSTANHDMQAPAGTLSAIQVVYNSVINAAVLIIGNQILGTYNPTLFTCYLAPPQPNTNMDYFVSAQRDGDSSEGWATAFLFDLYDGNNEDNFNTLDNTLGAVGHGDAVRTIVQLTKMNKANDVKIVQWLYHTTASHCCKSYNSCMAYPFTVLF